MTRECSTCIWWKKDYGMWCVNGWSGLNSKDGHCHYEPKRIYKPADSVCSHHEFDSEYAQRVTQEPDDEH